MHHVLEIFERLIAFPTVSRDGNIELIRYVHGLLAARGIEARLYPGKDGDRASLFASIGPDVAGGVVLSGHTDVVPVEGQVWESDPFRLVERDGRLFGRGAADMKGFVACAIAAMLAADPAKLRRPLHLALSYDEEIGCVGVRPMLAELAAAGIRPDWVLIGEPTAMQVAIGHKGKIGARAICCGRAAHSALAPTGLNAIHLAADFLSSIRALQDELAKIGARDPAYDVPYTTLHAGIIHGGTALNIVPDRCDLDFEIRNVAEDDPKAILDRLFARAEVLADVARKTAPEAMIRIEQFNDYPGLAVDAQAAVARTALALSGQQALTKVAFGTEGGLFQAALSTAAVVCGPGSMDQGHKPDEFVARSQIAACQAMLARLTDSLSA